MNVKSGIVSNPLEPGQLNGHMQINQIVRARLQMLEQGTAEILSLLKEGKDQTNWT